jgi:hypothetical protein
MDTNKALIVLANRYWYKSITKDLIKLFRQIPIIEDIFLSPITTSSYDPPNINKSIWVIEKERKKSLTRGHVEDIGSTVGIQSYEGQGYEGVMSGECIATSQHPSLRDGGALRGTCRARPVGVCDGLLLMGCSIVRWGCIRGRLVVSDSVG